jgi:hypothetical protein
MATENGDYVLLYLSNKLRAEVYRWSILLTADYVGASPKVSVSVCAAQSTDTSVSNNLLHVPAL